MKNRLLETTVNKRKEVIYIDDDDDDDDCVVIDYVSNRGATTVKCLENAPMLPTVSPKKKKRKSRKTYNSPSPLQVVTPTHVVTPTPPRVDPENVDEYLHKYHIFKKFDMVQDFSDHHYNVHYQSNLSKKAVKRIQEEWKILKESLPDKIFVRVCESRMDLLRAVIVGVEGTPFHDGLFFFDFYFPTNYPSLPPRVHYYSGGISITSILFSSGRHCISLLNTADGRREEMWIRGTSTILQVLVSLQGLVLSAKPIFNDPGVEKNVPEKMVLGCNESTYLDTLQTMLYNIHRVPPKHFEDFVVGHFLKHGRDILTCCKAYMNGAQVGCITKGSSVEDVGEGDNSSSQGFKDGLSHCFDRMVSAFLHIGAKDCEEFLQLGVPPIPFHRILKHPNRYIQDYYWI